MWSTETSIPRVRELDRELVGSDQAGSDAENMMASASRDLAGRTIVMVGLERHGTANSKSFSSPVLPGSAGSLLIAAMIPNRMVLPTLVANPGYAIPAVHRFFEPDFSCHFCLSNN